jgi:hypothetical protein
MKKIFLMTFICMLAVSVSAQKFNPDLSFLKGQQKLNVVIDYQSMTIDKDAEEDFVKQQMANEKSDEDKERWQTNWYGKWRDSYLYAFKQGANEEIDGKLIIAQDKSTEYTIIVKVIDIDPGNFAGPFSNPAKIKALLSIVKTEDNTIISKAEFKDIYTPVGIAPLIEIRIASAFSEVGETLGEIIKKAIK